MIPVVKVTKGSTVDVMADNKRGDSFQRQDSGFLSGSPTPVTPSRHDINGGPTYNNGSATSRDSTSYLPPIPERLNCREEPHLELNSQMESLSIRPPRPTTLSPQAPPPVPKEEDTMSPLLTPGTVLRHYNAGHLVPKHLEEYLEKRANKIVEEVVPLTPSDPIEFKALPSCEPQATSHMYPQQTILCPINQEILCTGMDNHYFEIRDYIRNDNEIMGEGGFGIVYACQDKIRDTLFAIKSNKHNSEDKIIEMTTECRMLAEIGVHSNITQMLGSVIDDPELTTTHFEGRKIKMLMECAINGTLSSLLTVPETGEMGLPLDQSLYYLQQILYAVHYLHQKNILHLDLKCANVLVFNDGRTVKLTDFGCAMRLDRFQGAQSQHPKGYTPNFSAPEVIRQQSVSFSADIWSLMCCFIEMLTGYLPWCYKKSSSCINVQCIIMLVGNYDEEVNLQQLLSQELIEDIELSLDVVELFKSVFKKESNKRPTALHLLENPLIKDAHEYERYFDEYAYEEAITPTEATPTYETPLSGGVKKSSSTESHSSIDSGNYDRSSSSNTSSPGSAGPLIDDSSKHNNKFPMSSIPDSTFRGLENQFGDMNFTSSIVSYRPLSLTSSSAPSDMTGGCWEENSGRGLFTGQDDNERDGARPVLVRGQLKRTTSANYVSNGPEVDSPDGRHHHRSLPQAASFVKNNSVFSSSNIVTVGMVSVGTQTSLSPTIESTSLLGSQTTYCSSSYR